MNKFASIYKLRLGSAALLSLLFLVRLDHASANDTISIDAGYLYGAPVNLQNPLASGVALPANSLLLLVASASGTTFGGPTPGSFTSGGDVILGAVAPTGGQGSNSNGGAGGLGSAGTETENNFIATSAQLASVPANTYIALYWFPSITLAQYKSGTTPILGTAYGAYNPQAITITANASQKPDGDDPWTLPADNGGNPKLDFFTAMDNGTQNELEGFARFTVVPEPSTYVLLGCAAAGFLGLNVYRRHRLA